MACSKYWSIKVIDSRSIQKGEMLINGLIEVFLTPTSSLLAGHGSVDFFFAGFVCIFNAFFVSILLIPWFLIIYF